MFNKIISISILLSYMLPPGRPHWWSRWTTDYALLRVGSCIVLFWVCYKFSFVPWMHRLQDAFIHGFLLIWKIENRKQISLNKELETHTKCNQISAFLFSRERTAFCQYGIFAGKSLGNALFDNPGNAWLTFLYNVTTIVALLRNAWSVKYIHVNY